MGAQIETNVPEVIARPEISDGHGFCSKYGRQTGAAKPAVRRGLRCGIARGFLCLVWSGGILRPRRQGHTKTTYGPTESSERTESSHVRLSESCTLTRPGIGGITVAVFGPKMEIPAKGASRSFKKAHSAAMRRKKKCASRGSADLRKPIFIIRWGGKCGKSGMGEAQRDVPR